MKQNKEPSSGKPISLKLYAELCWKRYSQMSKKEKMKFLDGVAHDCKASRQHVRRVMAHAVATQGGLKVAEPPKVLRGRKPLYAHDDELVRWLQEFWSRLNYPNTKVFPSMLREWMPYFDGAELPIKIKEKLLVMSGSTMEKLLRSYKVEHGKKHFAATKNKGRLKRMLIRVPERSLDFKVKSCGYMEGDTVAHCGSSLRGQHGWTLNSCCIHSSWTESEVFLGKEEESIVEAIGKIRGRLPFPMQGFHSDCGSEFLNEGVCSYLEDPQNYVVQTHGRAYRKNDQARVEQSNWTQVRQSFGYDRVEDKRVVDCMNDIYRNELRIIRNFFTYTLKQKSKIRVGSKYKRKFYEPKTPYQRVMEDVTVSEHIKEKLKAEKESYNPFEIKKLLDQKLKFFEKLLQNQGKTTEPRDTIATKKEAA